VNIGLSVTPERMTKGLRIVCMGQSSMPVREARLSQLRGSMTTVRFRIVTMMLVSLALAACTTTAASHGAGKHGSLLIETSACSGLPPTFVHPTPHVQLTIQRLNEGELSYHVLAWRRYRYSVPAGLYTVVEPGVTGERSVNAIVETGRTTSVAVPNLCK
jgi:hypothetical protein